MGCISRDTFKRLVLLYILGQFEQGSYGLKRLQKIAYFIQRDLNLKPFTFEKGYYGQYSEDLDEIKDQLISMGSIYVSPLATGRGNKYESTLKGRQDYYGSLTSSFDGVQEQIQQVVEEWGYKPEDEIIERAYGLDDLESMEDFEIIEESNLSDRINLEGVDKDECDELELAFNPIFIDAMRRIAAGLEESKLEIDKVKKIAFPV